MGRLSHYEIENLADRAVARIASGVFGHEAAAASYKLGNEKSMEIAVDVMGFYFGGDIEEIGSSDISCACHSVAKDMIAEINHI